MLRKVALVIVLASMACLFVSSASAQLIPTSFGFPVIVQSGNTVAFSQDTADALDYQDVSITFPTVDSGLSFGAVSLAFPSIQQTSLQTQSLTHTDFAQTSEFAEFAYPFVEAGSVVLPGFGLLY